MLARGVGGGRDLSVSWTGLSDGGGGMEGGERMSGTMEGYARNTEERRTGL